MSKRDLRAADVRTELTLRLDEAALVLKSGEASDEQIHSVRKTLKSARAKLRLLRDAVGRERYARENAALRDAARPLSDVRDSKVMLDTVNALLTRKGSRARRQVLTALRARFEHAHARARAKFEAEQLGAASAARLQRVAQRIEAWAPHSGRAALVHAIERMYRKARKALRETKREPSSENLHELRKQVKYLRAALTPLQSVELARGTILKLADRLASALGDDHDLHVLGETVAAPAPATCRAQVEALSAQLAKRRTKLQRRALKRARRLLRTKPARFARRLAL